MLGHELKVKALVRRTMARNRGVHQNNGLAELVAHKMPAWSARWTAKEVDQAHNCIVDLKGGQAPRVRGIVAKNRNLSTRLKTSRLPTRSPLRKSTAPALLLRCRRCGRDSTKPCYPNAYSWRRSFNNLLPCQYATQGRQWPTCKGSWTTEPNVCAPHNYVAMHVLTRIGSM